MFKKITSLTVSGALGVSLLFGIDSSASAEEQNDGKISVENREENLVNYLKDIPEKADINSTIDNYLEEHPIELKVTNTGEADNTSLDNVEDVPEYIDEQIDEGNFRAYDVNDDTQLIFTDSDTFFVSETDEGTEEPASDSELTSAKTLMMAAASTSSKKKHVSNSYTAKNWTGLTLWKAYISGWFTYNGTKVTAKEDIGYFKRGNVSVWNIDNQKSGGKSISTKTAELYVQGNASWGYGIGGQGITMQDKFVKVYLRSDSKGKVSKHRTIK
jgi:hypothetical protein